MKGKMIMTGLEALERYHKGKTIKVVPDIFGGISTVSKDAEEYEAIKNELNKPDFLLNELYKELSELQCALIPQGMEECRIHKAKIDTLRKTIEIAERIFSNGKNND